MPKGSYIRTDEHRQRLREGSHKGEKSSRWKDKIAYRSMHRWVAYHKERTGVCSNCGEKRYTEWSNVDHLYCRNLDDYSERCVPCHRKFDAV